MATNYKISCLCGTIDQAVASLKSERTLQLRHDHLSRHSSGVLFASYLPISTPKVSDELGSYNSDDATLHFYSKCGCQIFKQRKLSGEAEWAVATGVISAVSGNETEDIQRLEHCGASDTKDGGASVWIKGIDKEPTSEAGTATDTQVTLPTLPKTPSNALQASCACGNVRFHITRPDADSYTPHSNYPDLMYADKNCPESLKTNPEKDKWWVQGDGKKYMAGTCACRSCRLSTGFEIQTWAFVPRTNIFFHTNEDIIMPLDFEGLSEGILTMYSSRPGVFREFCGGCGATVFWHDTSRPGIIDVSVGLLMAEEGARAESWLSWWSERVSFEEDAEVGRKGFPARMARSLVTALEKGLKEWKNSLSEGGI
jgi:hypothetical protein